MIFNRLPLIDLNEPSEPTMYTYNLMDMGGYWSELVGTNDRVNTPFSVGEFPLQLSHNANFDGNGIVLCQDPSLYINECELFEMAKSGDEITIDYVLPMVTSVLEKKYFTLLVEGVVTNGEVGAITIRYNYVDKTVLIRNEYIDNYVNADHFPLLSDMDSTIITNASGDIIGVSIHGFLTTTMAQMAFNPYFGDEPRWVKNCKSSITFSSYDDLRIIVKRKEI